MKELFWLLILQRCPTCHARLYDWSSEVSICSGCGEKWS